MSVHWWKFTSLLVVGALLLTSCFAGASGVQEAARDALPKPPLEIANGSTSPLPGPDARLYDPPRPPLHPFAVGASLLPPVEAGSGLPGFVAAVGNPGPALLPPPSGPAFEWSQTDNYLILGTDHRPGWSTWRTDVVIVVGVDRQNNRMGVFSIPRDLYVNIPGYGWGRINQVDYLGEAASPGGGGPALVSQVLQDTLGISTNHWLRIRMDGFIDVVDAVGGVTVHLDCPFYEPVFNLTINDWDYFALPAGDVWMDGDTAYWFVRLRYRESDIGRNRRQRQFLWALRDQVVKTNLITKFPELWAAFRSTFMTDMNLFEILDMVNWGLQLDPASVRASGLSLYDLQSYRTEAGASVLRIANPAHVRAVVESIWTAPAMVDANRQDTTRCPSLPAGVEFAAAGNTPDLSTIDLDAEGAPPPPPEAETEVAVAPDADATELQRTPEQPTETPVGEVATEVATEEIQPTPEQPAEEPVDEVAPPDQPAEMIPTPTPIPEVSTFLLPTPTPAPVSIVVPPAPAGG